MTQMTRLTHVVDIDTHMQAQCWLNSCVGCVQRFKLSLNSFFLTCLWTVSSCLFNSVEWTTVFAAATYSERIQQFGALVHLRVVFYVLLLSSLSCGLFNPA